jgi:hypothetical protein
MGVLLKALSPPSAYGVKKRAAEGGHDLYGEVTDRIAGAMFARQLDEIDEWLDARPLEYPSGWDEQFRELIEARREEIAAEDIGGILRERFDFT